MSQIMILPKLSAIATWRPVVENEIQEMFAFSSSSREEAEGVVDGSLEATKVATNSNLGDVDDVEVEGRAHLYMEQLRPLAAAK